ncbi:DUF2304 domain-containing protein [Olsenella sp. HMSC062G07]|uniref:DUF2304 domain-containing protein n=1 Tax=Olsenella sp. HMSC062G07 TaxID=1739330 RepID=UPI0008A15777|nr:DUF2304 domain-containing protein [Olsenella sp. HMSC062G07]
MLPLQLRLLLVLGALLAFVVVSNRVRRERILVEDAIFWMVLAAVLVVLAIFPQIAVMASQALGFMSASNFIFLAVIVLLLWKAFTNASEISRLKDKVNELAQEIALERLEHEEARAQASEEPREEEDPQGELAR